MCVACGVTTLGKLTGSEAFYAASKCRYISDLTEDIISKVSNWAEKWLEVGEINADVMEYVLNFEGQPAKNYGLIKTHKPGRKLHVITVGTTIQLLLSYLLSLRDFRSYCMFT